MIVDVVAEVYPLRNVTGKILSKVVEFCKGHTNSDKVAREAELKAFHAEFIKNVEDHCTMLELIRAGNYLDIPGLLDAVAQAVANRMKELPLEDIRKMFNVQNDFTPKEEAHFREENAWAL